MPLCIPGGWKIRKEKDWMGKGEGEGEHGGR